MRAWPKPGRAQAAISPDGDVALAAPEEERAHGPTQDLHRRLVEVLPGDAADVVFPEDLRVDVQAASFSATNIPVSHV